MVESQTNQERNRKSPAYQSNQRYLFQKQENLWKPQDLSEDEKDGLQYIQESSSGNHEERRPQECCQEKACGDY